MINDMLTMYDNNAHIRSNQAKDEKKFINRWKKLDNKVSTMAYRLYSNFIGNNPDIVPEDTARQYIEPILNFGDCEKFYSDKNSFGLFINPEDMPKTLFRSIGYKLYDGNYNNVIKENFDYCFANQDKVVVKPAKDLGGHGITFFERIDGTLVNCDGQTLTLDYLLTSYKTDFLIQECFAQSSYMSQFNPSSVNTIRVNTYRDVNTGEIHVLGAALRIGA